MEAEESAPSMSAFKTIQNSYLQWNRSKTKLKVVLENAVTQEHTKGSYSFGLGALKVSNLKSNNVQIFLF